jgi:hypothetical protein
MARKNAAKQRSLDVSVPKVKLPPDIGAALGRRAANAFVSTNARTVPKASKMNTSVPALKPGSGGV